MKWNEYYEWVNEKEREEQLKRIYPYTQFKIKKVSTLNGFNKKESEKRIEKYNKGSVCINCGLRECEC